MKSPIECKGCTIAGNCFFLRRVPLNLLKQCPCGNCLIKVKCLVECSEMKKFHNTVKTWASMRAYKDYD